MPFTLQHSPMTGGLTANPAADIVLDVKRVRRERDGGLYWQFRIPCEDGKDRAVTLSQALSSRDIAKELRKVTSSIPDDQREAVRTVRALLEGAPAGVLIGADEPGWKADASAYISSSIQKGPGCDNYLWLGPENQSGNRGTFKRWQPVIGDQCAQSSYLAFGLMLGLAGPLLRFANLPEGAVFHLYGDTTTGKTTVARVAASISQKPDVLPGWDMTPRALEEAAAGCRDRLMILNAAEKANVHQRGELLRILTHGIAEGTAMIRSGVVQSALPNLSSRSPVLSTGNLCGAELAQRSRISWDAQDEARFISIPVPSLAKGGIMDRLGHREIATTAISNLERSLARYYGTALGGWVSCAHRNRRQVDRLIDQFCSKVGARSPYDRRIAAKFGLVYAAGKIAVDDGILGWDPNLPLQVTRHLFHRAMSAQAARRAAHPLVRLERAIANPALFPDAGCGKELRVDDPVAVPGFRFEHAGKRWLAIRQEGLAKLFGPAAAETVIGALIGAAIVRPGHGGKLGQQVRVSLVGPKSRIDKPRALIIPEKSLAHIASLKCSAPT